MKQYSENIDRNILHTILQPTVFKHFILSAHFSQVYVAFINSVLNERHLSIRSVDDLRKDTPVVNLNDIHYFNNQYQLFRII